MASRKPMSTKEITDLITQLKSETPDYPADLLAARKAAFLKQAVNISISTKGGPQGSSGGSGAAVGGGATSQGILLQALIGISVVAALLLAAFAYRNQIPDPSQGNEVVAQEEISSPLAPEVVVVETDSLLPLITAPRVTPTVTPWTPVDDSDPSKPSVAAAQAEKTKTNSGLHLGQTPGTPAAPGQGNPGNVNKPDKPDKPEKPEKPKKEK